MTEHNTHLEVDIADKPESWTGGCDGCGRVPQEGDLLITRIESCCGGGCCRELCANCIKAAAKMIEDAENKAAGILTIPGIDPNGYTTASAAIGEMLSQQGFNNTVVNQGWVELRIIASFQDKGAMFQHISLSRVPPKGDLADNEAVRNGAANEEKGNATDDE